MTNHKSKIVNHKLRVLSIFGTRPEAVKMAPVVQELKRTPGVESFVCVTAQHREMLDQVLTLFEIKPDVDLNLMQADQSLAELSSNIFRDLDPVVVEALESSSMVRVGFAVEVSNSGPLWVWTDADHSVAGGLTTYTPRPFRLNGAPAYGDPARTKVDLTVADADHLVADEVRDPGLYRRRVKVYELLAPDWATPPALFLWMDGAVESVRLEHAAGLAILTLGPRVTPWGLLVPKVATALCQYVATSQCPHVATCARTEGACTANGQLDIFGGFTKLPVAGTRLEFGDHAVTIKASNRTY